MESPRNRVQIEKRTLVESNLPIREGRASKGLQEEVDNKSEKTKRMRVMEAKRRKCSK